MTTLHFVRFGGRTVHLFCTSCSCESLVTPAVEVINNNTVVLSTVAMFRQTCCSWAGAVSICLYSTDHIDDSVEMVLSHNVLPSNALDTGSYCDFSENPAAIMCL